MTDTEHAEIQQAHQLAQFINPSMSVYRRFVWVQGSPENWSTKWSETIDGQLARGAYEAAGFATCVLGQDDGIPMVAYLNEIELLGHFASKVTQVDFAHWKQMTEEQVRALAVIPDNGPTQ